MGKTNIGLAAMALASLAGTGAQAASAGVKTIGRSDAELAQPAPVPGTFDFQLAQLSAGAAAHAGPAAGALSASPEPDRPDVTMARRFVDAAWAFDSYTRRVAALDGAFTDGVGVSRAVTASAGYEPSQLAEGAIAWGAMAALQDAGFVDAVRGAAPDAASREALVAELLARPAAVLHLPGAREAAMRVSDLVGRRGAGLVEAGAAVNKASYGVQKSAWAKTSLDKPAERLAAVKTLGARRTAAGEADTAELMKAMTALRPAAGQSRAAPDDWRPTPAVARSVALAALALLGRAGEERAAEAAPLLVTAQGEDCLKMAKLNLNQCLAVAGPRYEDMFCLGRHAVADTGQCLVSTAGWTPAAAAAPRLVAAAAPVAAPVAAPAPVPVIVPIALAALDGPERAAAFSAPASVELAAEAPAVAEAAPATAAFADDAPPARPSWSRPARDEDEAEMAPRRVRAEPRLAPADVEADGEAEHPPSRVYARASDLRYGRTMDDDSARAYARPDAYADDGEDQDAPPPPRRRAPAPGWGYPGYAYGYGGYGAYDGR